MKKWYTSKTIWVNALALGGLILQTATGNDILPLDVQAPLLIIINLILRAVTKTPIDWS
jgi:hypothetical protein